MENFISGEKKINEVILETVRKISALGVGTLQKLQIIDFLRAGEKSYPEIHKKFSSLPSATLYKYLQELYEAGILYKRIENEAGRRPITSYRLGILYIILTPEKISGLIENKEMKSNLMEELMRENFPKIDIDVIGKGVKTKFSHTRLLNDLLSAGIKLEDAIGVLTKIRESIYNNISTKDIADMCYKVLCTKNKELGDVFKSYIKDELTVRCEDGIEIWDEKKISKRLIEKRKKGEFPAEDVKFLSHKIVRDTKKVTQTPTKSFVDSYIEFIAETF